MTSPIRTVLKLARSGLDRTLTPKELVGAFLLVVSVIVGLFAIGLRSTTLGIFAGAAFIIGDVLWMLGNGTGS